MKSIITAVIIFAATFMSAQDSRVDSLLNHTVVIGGDVFSTDKCGDLYILHAESCEHVVYTGSKEDVLSLLYWIEQYPCENLRYAQNYYHEMVVEKIHN
jgi:hypothetical protein